MTAAAMFTRFLELYTATDTAARSGDSLFAPGFSHLEGVTFDGGLYRLHTGGSGRRADELVEYAFPAFTGRIRCFGFDWLGNQFAADFGRLLEGQPRVVLFEPGTGESLDIPVRFDRFHDEELVDFAERALALSFFEQWRAADGRSLRFDQCIGYSIPLFLSGADTLDNLEVIDIDVYWALTGQLLRQTRGLPPGTRLGPVSIDD